MPRALVATPAGLRLQLARAEAAAADSPEALQFLSQTEVLSRQSENGLGDEWGVLKFRREWLPPGAGQAGPRLDIRKTLLNQTGGREDNIDNAILSLSRLALIYFLLPQPSKNTRVMWKPSTVIKRIEAACRLAGKALCSEGRSAEVFGRLTVSSTSNFKPIDQRTIQHLIRLGKLGLWVDVPRTVEPDELEARRRGQKVPQLELERPEPHKPLSDEFVGEGGWRLAWIAEQLGPCIVKCANGLAQARAAVQHHGADDGYQSRLGSASAAYLELFDWRTADGSRLSSLPFPIRFEGDLDQESERRTDTSLPQRFSDFRALLKVLEGSHLFIFLLSCGGRASEMLSLQPGCVKVSATTGAATTDGRTYKLTQIVGGEERDWPLPEMGVLAIRQQEQLKSAVLALYPDDGAVAPEERPPESIWCRITTGAWSFTTDYNDYLVDTVKMLGLDHLIGRGLSAHRFRKTTARIIALAVVSAPELLMRLFGHREMQMTLYYILSDPSIRGEVEAVMKAQTIMLAENAIRKADELGGLAAPRVQAAVAFAKARHGKEFHSVGIKELAETLTFSGQYWRLVRGHVICTKGPLQESPCKRGSAATDPANCQSKCPNRLEDGFLRSDVDETISEAIRQFDAAEIEGDEILSAEWLGQINANLRRFADIDAKWQFHPAVQQLLKDPASTSIELENLNEAT